MTKPGHMYEHADAKSKVVRPLDAGMMLYPTGNKDGVWWEVKDELGNTGLGVVDAVRTGEIDSANMNVCARGGFGLLFRFGMR